jgi:hypothetical protein
MKKTAAVVVKQPEIDPVPLEIMAQSIVAISEGIKKLRATRLNERALVLLIQHAAPSVGRFGTDPSSQKQVRAVLAGIEGLEREYLKPAKQRD